MKLTDALIIGFLALLLILSGLDKLFHYSGFVNAVRNYAVVPVGTADFLALPIISGEMLVGVGLLVPSTRRLSSGLASILFFVFTIALLMNSMYGERGICGCWFTITVAEGPLHIIQNISLSTLAALTFWSESGRQLAFSADSGRTAIPPEYKSSSQS